MQQTTEKYCLPFWVMATWLQACATTFSCRTSNLERHLKYVCDSECLAASERQMPVPTMNNCGSACNELRLAPDRKGGSQPASSHAVSFCTRAGGPIGPPRNCHCSALCGLAAVLSTLIFPALSQPWL